MVQITSVQCLVCLLAPHQPSDYVGSLLDADITGM